MSETALATAPAPAAPAAPAPAPATPTTAASAPATPPEGFVSREDLVKEQERARSFQSEADRYKAELAKATAPPAAPAVKEDGSPDYAAIIGNAMSDAVGKVLRAGELREAATTLKTEFPYADPTLFSSEKLPDFDSADSLRVAAEASHKRVADILAVAQGTTDEATRAAQAAVAAGAAGPGTAVTAPVGGDPTIEQLNTMSLNELERLEAAHPGTAKRVMGLIA